MITKNNLKEVVNQLSDRDKNRIKKSSKEFIVLELHVFNSGSVTTCILTNCWWKYKHVSDRGDSLMYLKDIKEMLEGGDKECM